MRRMPLLSMIGIALLGLSLSGKEPYDWKPGKVVKLSANPPISSMNAPRYPHLTKVFTYSIQGADGLHRALYKGKSAVAALDTQVEFSVAGKALYIKGGDGKVHKLVHLGGSPIQCPGCMQQLRRAPDLISSRR